MTTVTICVLWLVGVLMIFTVSVLVWRLTGYLNRPDKTVVGEFLENGQPKPDYAAKFHDRWLNFRFAGGELEKAGIDLPFSTGGDFLLAEIEQRTGTELEKAIGELGKEVDLKVAGISIQGFAKFLDSLTPRPSRTIEGRLNRFGNEVVLIVTLRHRSEVEKIWSFTKTIDSDQKAPIAIDYLIDEAICQAAIYLRPMDPKAAKGGTRPMDNIAQLSPEALASLTKGRRSLDRYIRDNEQSDLLAAQEHFRSLVDSNPTFVDGYMTLAYTLAENRQEREAVEMYDRVIRLLSDAGQKEDKRSYEARFLKACSLLRCYGWKDAIMAIKEFLELAAKLDKLIKPQDEGQEKLAQWRYNRYLLARCYAEVGHCFGHLIVFLPKDKPLRDFERSALKELIEKNVLKELTLPDQGQDRFADRAQVAKRLHAASVLYQDLSKNVDPIYKEEWRDGLRVRLSEVAGYARYRSAEWLDAGNSDKFRKECTEATRSLQEAELRKPRSYALLQNIGMILLNRRYDPDGSNLAQAENYYQRSVKLKPNDYYGYEQLARIHLRRMLVASEQSERNDEAKNGEESIATALKIRFESRGAVFLRFYFRLAKFYFQNTSVQPKEVEALQADIDRYEPDKGDTAYRWMRLYCYFLQLLATPDETKFGVNKAHLLNQLTEYKKDFKGDVDQNWRTNQMLDSIQKLEKELAGVTYGTRSELRFDPKASLD